MASFSPREISIVEAVAKGTGVPADVLAGLLRNESGGKPTALAMNPRFIYAMTSTGKRGKKSPQSWLIRKLKGTLAEKLGSAGKAAYKSNARKVFDEIYRHSPYWAVRCGAFGYFGVLGGIAMRRYGGVSTSAAQKFYEAFKENPHQAGIDAAIDWWNLPTHAGKRQSAKNRDWRKITIGYLGGPGTWYAPRMEKNAGIYRRQRGMSGGSTSTTPARRIALIGDSNSGVMNTLYAAHFSGDKVLKAGSGEKIGIGADVEWFLSLLKAVEAGDASQAPSRRGGRKAAKMIIDFKPEIIHITAMGGNNASRGDTIGKNSGAKIKKMRKEAQELFTIIKKYKGTVHGPPKSRPGATAAVKGQFHASSAGAAERYALARAKVAEVLGEAADSVGVPYFNPWAGKVADITKKGAYRGDGIHMSSGAAQVHFDAAKAMLGGGTSGSGGGTYVGSGMYAPSTGAYDPDDPEGRLAQGEEEMAAKEREKKAAEMRTKAFRSAVEKAFTSQFNKDAQGNIVGPADKSKMNTHAFKQDLDRARSMQRMTADEIVNQAFEEQNAPTPDQLAAAVENPDEEIEAPTARGVILKKYVKKLNQHQPDFNFDEFYKEADVYLKNKSDELFPKSGRDYVFGDEHWKAFVVVRNLKDKKQAVSESLRLLGSLVREVRQKW